MQSVGFVNLNWFSKIYQSIVDYAGLNWSLGGVQVKLSRSLNLAGRLPFALSQV